MKKCYFYIDSPIGTCSPVSSTFIKIIKVLLLWSFVCVACCQFLFVIFKRTYHVFFHMYCVFVVLLAKTCCCVLCNQYFLDFSSKCRVCFCVIIYCSQLNMRLLSEKFRFECLMECVCIVYSRVFLFQPI